VIQAAIFGGLSFALQLLA